VTHHNGKLPGRTQLPKLNKMIRISKRIAWVLLDQTLKTIRRPARLFIIPYRLIRRSLVSIIGPLIAGIACRRFSSSCTR